MAPHDQTQAVCFALADRLDHVPVLLQGQAAGISARSLSPYLRRRMVRRHTVSFARHGLRRGRDGSSPATGRRRFGAGRGPDGFAVVVPGHPGLLRIDWHDRDYRRCERPSCPKLDRASHKALSSVGDLIRVSVARPRRTFSMILSASACQVNGLGSSFQCSAQVSIASMREPHSRRRLSGVDGR